MASFQTFTELRRDAHIIHLLPTTKLAVEVLKANYEVYMADPERAIRLHPAVSPHTLEACLAEVLGRSMMALIVRGLPLLTREYQGTNLSDMYGFYAGHRSTFGLLLTDIESSKVPSVRPEALVELTYCLLSENEGHMRKFMLQAINRLHYKLR
jgi:hypothetical protein